MPAIETRVGPLSQQYLDHILEEGTTSREGDAVRGLRDDRPRFQSNASDVESFRFASICAFSR